MTDVRETRSPYLPPATVALCLVAMGALFATSKGYLGLPLLQLALVATYVVPRRLPPSPLLAWAIRVVVFGAILLSANPEKRADVGSVVFDPGWTNLFGYLCAAELVIRAWVGRRGGPSKGEMVLLSALVLTAATNAGDMKAVWWVRTLAPFYAVFLVLTLRRFRERSRGFAWGWVVVMLLTVGVGFTWSWAIGAFENSITRWSMQFLSGKARDSGSIGLGRTATLGRVFNPYPSARRVMQLHGWPGEHHLRAVAFDQYAAGTWGPPVDQREFGARAADPSAPVGRGRTVAATRFLSTFNLVCLPLETVGLTFAADAVEVQQDDSGAIRTSGDGVPDPLDYSFVVAADNTQGILTQPLKVNERRWDLIVPKEIDPRVQELANKVATGATPAIKLAQIQTYLGAHHHYSLDVDPGEGDPVSAFVLNNMDGHCEYFASAVVVLARSAGIPARYVSGYYAHEPAGDGDGTVVRERDAHAWAECWVEGTGWVTVDATPAGGRPDALFTETPAWRRAWERVQDWLHAVRVWLSHRSLIEGAVMIAVLAAIPVFIRVWKGRGTRRKGLALAGYGAVSPELAEVVRRFERLLRRRKIVCPPDRTWQEHLAEVPGCGEFVREYNAVRFGGEGSVGQLGETVDRLEREWVVR